MRPKKSPRKPARSAAAKGGKPGKRPQKAMRLASGAATLAVGIIVAWTAGATLPGFAAEEPPEKTHQGTVIRIVDGDTFYLSGVKARIRLWGLDAPELSERGGNASKRALREIAHGRRVLCKEIDIDRFDRIVGQCFLPDGGDVAALMIASGNARDYARYSGGYYSAVKVASND